MAPNRIAPLVLCLGMLWSASAAAQDFDDTARATARELAEEGGALYLSGQWAEALVKLDKAYAILRVPTLGHYSARCLESLGRWVEASERYLEVTKLPLPDRSPEPHKKAQEDSARAREALLPRIPRLRIVIAGAEPSEVTLSVDGKPLAVAMVDVAFPVDPGAHQVRGVRRSQQVDESARLEEGEELRLELRFEPEAREPAPPSQPRPAPAPRARSLPVAPADDGPSSAAIGGYLALGLGGASLVAGIVTGSILLATGASLDDDCVDAECLYRAEGDADTYNALRPTTTVTLAVGAAGVAAGLLLLFVVDDGEAAAVIGPGWLGARVRF